MQFWRVLISFIASIALLASTETIPDNIDLNSTGDFSDLATSESDIFDVHEPNPYSDLSLFSDADSDKSLAWSLNLNSEDLPPPAGLLTIAGVDDDAIASCLSSSFQNTLATDDLQARSSTQCPNPLETLDSGSTTTTTTTPNDQRTGGFVRTPSINWSGSNQRLCPFERYHLRSLPLCDSGKHDDIIQDDDEWVTDLINPTYCMYEFSFPRLSVDFS